MPGHISIHAPRGGSDSAKTMTGKNKIISIHAPRGGSDFTDTVWWVGDMDFNPRSPWGERLGLLQSRVVNVEFQSTLPVGERRGEKVLCSWYTKISIHAPRGGSDP